MDIKHCKYNFFICTTCNKYEKLFSNAIWYFHKNKSMYDPNLWTKLRFCIRVKIKKDIFIAIYCLIKITIITYTENWNLSNFSLLWKKHWNQNANLKVAMLFACKNSAYFAFDNQFNMRHINHLVTDAFQMLTNLKKSFEHCVAEQIPQLIFNVE